MYYFRYLLGTFLLLSFSPAWASKEWKSGELISQQHFLYGAFEARIKASIGRGGITAFYLMTDGSGLPSVPWQEMTYEVFGKDGARVLQSQVITPGDPRTQHMIKHPYAAPFSDDFHIYRLEWTPDALAFYMDGVLLRKETDPVEYRKFFDPKLVEPMRLRISLWAGFSSWSGLLDPQKLPTPVSVDWVRYASYDPKLDGFRPEWEENFDSFSWERWHKAEWTFEYAANDYEGSQAQTEKSQLVIRFEKK